MSQYPASSLNSKLLVTKANAVGQYRIGSAGVSAVNGTTAWTQVAASLSGDTLVTSVFGTAGGSGFDLTDLDYVEIAVGGAGSEVVVAAVPLYNAAVNASNMSLAQGFIPIPNRIGAGQRVSIRLTAGARMSSVTLTLHVFGVPYANVEGN